MVAEEYRRKDESVFEPLQRTEELDVVYHLLPFDAANLRLLIEFPKIMPSYFLIRHAYVSKTSGGSVRKAGCNSPVIQPMKIFTRAKR